MFAADDVAYIAAKRKEIAEQEAKGRAEAAEAEAKVGTDPEAKAPPEHPRFLAEDVSGIKKTWETMKSQAAVDAEAARIKQEGALNGVSVGPDAQAPAEQSPRGYGYYG